MPFQINFQAIKHFEPAYEGCDKIGFLPPISDIFVKKKLKKKYVSHVTYDVYFHCLLEILSKKKYWSIFYKWYAMPQLLLFQAPVLNLFNMVLAAFKGL